MESGVTLDAAFVANVLVDNQRLREEVKMCDAEIEALRKQMADQQKLHEYEVWSLVSAAGGTVDTSRDRGGDIDMRRMFIERNNYARTAVYRLVDDAEQPFASTKVVQAGNNHAQ